MTDYEILKHEEKFCHDIWDSNHNEEVAKGNQYANLEHMHVCDFELCNFKYCKNRRALNKLVKKKCKEYLASIGKERDEECMTCCDECIHSRYVTISNTTEDLVLNIATLALRYKDYNALIK